jgi:hypothetical protein
VWHELALALGRTVGELQASLSHAEWARWLVYRKTHGPMTDERRYDRPAALLAHLYASAHSKNPPSMTDFMPWSEQPAATLHDLARELGV